MKKFLLLIISMACAVTGAWAEASYPQNFGTNSSVNYDSTSGILSVTIGTTGDFATFVGLITSGDVNVDKTGNLRIVCTSGVTISNTEVTSLKTAKSNNGFTMLDLTGAAFDADATITSLMGNGVCYVSLPTNKSISDVSLPATSNYGLKAVITSDATNATYTAYGGENWGSSYPIFTNSTLNSIGNWTITNGASFTSGITVAAGALNGPGQLNAILSNSTASTLSVTMDISELDNNYIISPSSSSITALTISGLKYSSSVSWAGLTIDGSGATALTSLTMDDCTANSLIVKDFAELTAADLKGVTKAASGSALAVTFNNDPKLTTVKLYRSSAYTTYTADGTTPSSGVTVTWESPAIPLEYDGCKVTVNLAHRGISTMSDLISTAKKTLGSTDICTLIVTGELSTDDLESLDDANTATRIDLSEATLASGASVNSIQVPTKLLSLVLPPGNTVSSTLATTLSSATNFEYVYSNTSDGGATVPTYVWIAKTGVMPQVFANESSLISCVYLKVSAKSGIALESTSVDLNGKGLNNLQYLDVSESGLTTAAAPYYKAPHWNPYRIILPNNWSGDDMAIFAANSNVGSIAAVYSYHGTTLKIMEIVDNSYSPAALADPRIMKSTTTEVDIVSGYYNGQTYAQFGTNLLEALNNMGKSSFSVTKDNVTTNYNNTAGLNVTTINIETTSAAPNTLTFTNPVITTLNIENLSQTNAQLNVDACTSLTTLDLSGSSLQSIDASTTSLTTADLSGTAISGATDFSGATALATFTTTDETSFGGALNLTSSALTSFTSAARFSGDITLNASNSLASIDVSSATFTNTTSKIHIHATNDENDTNVLSGLKNGTNTIKVPTGFNSDSENRRIHPYDDAANCIEEQAAVAAAVTYAASDMVFHDNNTNDAYYPTYRYWYQGSSSSANQIATLGTSNDRSLNDIIEGNSNLNPSVVAHDDLTNNTHVKIKVVGPLTATCLTKLKNLNCTTLDLSEATITVSELQTALASDILHANTKFLVLPSTCTRDDIINGTQLAKLANVYSVIAVETTNEGRNLTSWSRVSGALQPAVVSALSSAANSWSLEPEGESARSVYTTNVSNFKVVKLSGLINSYDLGGPVQGGLKLDENGHLSWAEEVTETTSQTRTLNGSYKVYGPFAASFLLNVIDLKDAYFEPLSGQSVSESSVYYRYYYSDMTLSALALITTGTYKVVIPQNSKVREIPADFMNCATKIRAICIPSNIQAIRARAFYTIDYVWTTPDAYATSSSTSDPEGNNTRLDNGARLSVDGGSNFIETSALIYKNGAYKENPDFFDSYYTADYSTINGGGTYTFGSTLKLIETGAFANTQPNVRDVYVLNTTAPECHVDAFNTVMYTGNGGYNSAAVSSEGIITREAYYNGRWITMLHYPRQTTTPNVQRYTDPTRQYSIATGERDGKGATLYFPNQSEFIRAYTQGTFGYIWNAWNPAREYGSVNNGGLQGHTTEGWTAAGQTTANGLFDAYSADNHKYTSFYKVSDFTGETVTAPQTTIVPYYQVNWNDASYAYSTENLGNLYPQSELDAGSDVDRSGEQTEKDYRGWHQFVLNAYAANTILDEEPYRSYIEDNEWWTICSPFDITREEAILLFGTPAREAYAGHGKEGDADYIPPYAAQTEKIPYVSKLRYVRRTYDEPMIHLNFSENLMVYKEQRANATDQHGTNDDNGVVQISSTEFKDDNSFTGSSVVISAGVPYMIKPNITAEDGGFNRQFQVYTSTDYAKLTDAQKYATSPRAVESNGLFAKIKAANERGGAEQRSLVETGKYSVPVFVSGTNNGYSMEGTEGSYTIGGQNYKKSTEFYYTFVGSFYNSYMPQYAYFLGWNGSKAQFFYNDAAYDGNNMRWANETGIICATTAAFTATVTQATTSDKGLVPAQWVLNGTAKDDSFKATSGGRLFRLYDMTFDAPDVIAVQGDATGIKTVGEQQRNSQSMNVYSVDGQLKGNSLQGLSKGIYVVNGKKYVVK